jgi:dolichol-phosphate mannosyltransferase
MELRNLSEIRAGRISNLRVTIVVPVFDEAANISSLASEIDATMSSLPIPWECVWVDDGSTDETPALLSGLCGIRHNHRLVVLECNQGQSAALAAGFAECTTPLIATMDGDGQNDPADLRRMIDLILSEDLDVVGGYRTNRHSVVRSITSRIANGFRNAVTRDSVRDVGCSLRVMRSEYLDGIPVFKGMHRFLPTLMRFNGCERQRVIPVSHRRRTGGRSKYGTWNRLWVGIADTFAVRWWSKRMVIPNVRARVPADREVRNLPVNEKEQS